jgi:hypothetical protein
MPWHLAEVSAHASAGPRACCPDDERDRGQYTTSRGLRPSAHDQGRRSSVLRAPGQAQKWGMRACFSAPNGRMAGTACYGGSTLLASSCLRSASRITAATAETPWNRCPNCSTISGPAQMRSALAKRRRRQCPQPTDRASHTGLILEGEKGHADICFTCGHHGNRSRIPAIRARG